MTRRSEGQFNFGAITERDDGFKQELVATERPIPYQLVLMNAIEDTRRALINNEDGGVSALLALVSVLPEDIRKELGSMEDDIHKYLELRIYLRPVTRTEKKYISPKSHLVDKWTPDGKGYLGTEWVRDKTGKTIWMRYTSLKLKGEYVTARAAQRDFVCASLAKIIGILDRKGLLWRSRTELVGGED